MKAVKEGDRVLCRGKVRLVDTITGDGLLLLEAESSHNPKVADEYTGTLVRSEELRPLR
jgi:hypothetical protein